MTESDQREGSSCLSLTAFCMADHSDSLYSPWVWAWAGNRRKALAEIFWLFSVASRNTVACTCGDYIVSFGVSCPIQQEGKGKFTSAGEKSCKLQGYRAVSEANFKSWGFSSLMTGEWFELAKVVGFYWFLSHFYRLFVRRKKLQWQDVKLQFTSIELRCMCNV